VTGVDGILTLVGVKKFEKKIKKNLRTAAKPLPAWR
jgi:hypothetical protein